MRSMNVGRVSAGVCALLLLLLAFQSLQAEASLPVSGLGEFNHALSANGATATASSLSGSYVSSKAIDGNPSTYWQSAERLGWLAVAFRGRAFISEVHVHFVSTVYPSLSLYFDTNGNGLYESTERIWSTTSNKLLDVVVATATTEASGMKVTIDAKVGSRQPKIAEFEAYLRGDTDGDGLTNTQEASVVFHQDVGAEGLPQRIPNVALDTVLFYNMGATTVDGRIYDVSGSGNTATVRGTASVAGKLGLARSFDGYDDFVEAADSDALDVRGHVSIAMWVYLAADPNCDARNNWRVLLSKYSSSGSSFGSYFIFLEENRRPSWSVSSGGAYQRFFPSAGTVPVGAWTHLAFTRDSATGLMSYYVNGALLQSQAPGAGPIDNSTGSLRLGGGVNVGCSDGDGFFPGYIDEVQVWGRVLAPSEVMAYVGRSAPVLYYDMEVRRAADLQDLSGNGNVGAATGTLLTDGKLGSALQFNGASDYVLAANPMGGFPRDSMTLTAWIRRQGAGVIFDEQGSGAPNSWWHDSQIEVLADGTVRMGVWPRTATLTCGSIDTEWHQLALTYDRSTGALTCYVDGASRDSKTVNRDSSGAQTYVFGKGDTTNLGHGGSFQGTIDEVQIWNVALPAARIRESYTAGVYHRSAAVVLSQFHGVAVRALGTFTIDHPAKADLTASVGYWDGTGWNDRYVWDPGRRVSAPSGGGGGGGGGGLRPVAVPGSPVEKGLAGGSDVSPVDAAGAGTAFGVLTSDWTPGEFDSGTRATVFVDLVAPQTAASSSENASGILRPEFPIAFFTTYLTWRIVVRDWSANGAGDLLAFSLRFEAGTDPLAQDTDGDGISDYGERAVWATLPVTQDSDLDGLSEGVEIQPRDLTLTVDGLPVTIRGIITDPIRADTDDDGLTDGQEWGAMDIGSVTNPLGTDTDGDTLTDGAEVHQYGSSPTLRDTDADTIPDDVEVTPRTLTLTINGATRSRLIATAPNAKDSDADGIQDQVEWLGASSWGVVTDPTDADTDDDGLYDGGEAHIREFAMDGRAPLGTFGSRSVGASPAGVVESVEVRYSTSGADIASIQVRVDHDGMAGPFLWTGSGSGNFLHESADITASFPGMPKAGTYSITVWSSAGNVVLEEFTVRFKIQTSPIRSDTDGDALGDKEELENGQDGWVTDPNAADTDGDGWSDSLEYSRGTNPLLADTDQDGVRDPLDIDPLHNLLLAVTVERIHHGNLALATDPPTLMAIVRMNDDYAYATEHRQATEEKVCTYWLVVCLREVSSTGVFFLTYYADVPDDRGEARIRVFASDIDIFTGDDPLLERTISYRLGDPFAEKYWSSDNLHWVTYRVETVRLDKVRTLAVTDGRSIVSDQYGTPRYGAAERFAVFLLQATSSYGEIGSGLNAILVPESLFAQSQLKARLANGISSPLEGATFYDGDPTKARMSEGIAALVAGTLGGYEAWLVLQYLLQDAQGTPVFQVVDVTGRVFGLNLPGDVVRIIPWVGVSNGATGEMPQNFWQKVGAVATTLLNALVYAGQLIYSGLIAIGSFFADLGQAIVNWGMQALGLIRERVEDVRRAIETAREVFQKLLDWAIDWAMGVLHAIVDPIIESVRQMFEDLKNAILRAFNSVNHETTADAFVTFYAGALFGSQVFFSLLLLAIGISVVEKITMVGSGGVGALVMNVIIPVVRDLLIASLVTMAVVQVFNTALPAEDQLTSFIPPQFSDAAGWTFGFSKFYQKFALDVAARERGWASLPLVERAFQYILFSFVLLYIRLAIEQSGLNRVVTKVVHTVLAFVAVYIAWFVAGPSLGKARGPLSRFYPLMFPVGEALGTVAKVSSIATLVQDVAALGGALGKW